MVLFNAIEEATNTYNKKNEALNNPVLNEEEKQYWTKFITNCILTKGNSYSNCIGSTISIYDDLYDLDVFFKDDKINSHRVPAFGNWLKENGCYIHSCCNCHIEIITPQMIKAMEDNYIFEYYDEYKIEIKNKY